MVGIMHGMAGSAAVILLTLDRVASPLWGMLYILVFGLGSVLGMALLSIAIFIPMRSSARRLTWAHNIFQILIAAFTIGMGALVLLDSGPPLFV